MTILFAAGMIGGAIYLKRSSESEIASELEKAKAIGREAQKTGKVMSILVEAEKSPEERNAERITKRVVTQFEFQQLVPGLSYQEAVNIIGFYGEERSRSHVDGIPGVTESIDCSMYGWHSSDGGYINAIFQNNRLTTTSQIGLTRFYYGSHGKYEDK